jgi:hypothetical protein
MKRRLLSARPRVLSLALALTTISGVLPRGAGAQALVVEPQIGISLPRGELSSFVEHGVTTGARVEYSRWTKLGFVAEAGAEFLRGKPFMPGTSRPKGPDLSVLNYTVGAKAALVAPPGMARITGEIQAGGRTYRSESFAMPEGSAKTFNHTYPTVAGGLRLELPVREGWDIVASGKATYSPIDEDDTVELSEYTRGWVNTFDQAVTVPFSLGVRVRL